MSATATLVPEFSIAPSTTPEAAITQLNAYVATVINAKLAAPETTRYLGKAQSTYAEYVAALNAAALAEATASKSNVGKTYTATITTPKRTLSLQNVRVWPLPYYAEEWLQIFACRNAVLSLIRDRKADLVLKRPEEFSALFDAAVNGDTPVKFNGVRETKAKRESAKAPS